MKTVQEREKKSFETMKGKFGYKNKLAAPRLVKVVVSSGTGTGVKKDKNRNDLILDRMGKITGQKGSVRNAKQAVATFKIRQGDPIGVMTTLRGARMYSFLNKLLDVSIPRTKDFRGLERRIVDNIGNMTMSVKENTIFPETNDEELKDVFGMGITFVSTAKTREEGEAFFELLGVPFKKEEDSVKKKK